MNTFRGGVASLAACALMSACAVAKGPGLTPVTNPTQRIDLAGFSLLPPRGDKWFVASATVAAVGEMPLADPAGLLWERLEGPSRRCFIGPGQLASVCTQPRDATAGEIMFAKVLGPRSAVIALAETAEAKDIGNVADMQSYVEATISRLTTTSTRSRLLDSRVSVDRSLGSNCVRYDLTQEERATPGAVDIFIVTTRAIRCLHPQWPAYAVDVGYRQRHPQGTPPVAVGLELEPLLTSFQFSSDRPLPLTRILIGDLVPPPQEGKVPEDIGIGHGSVWVVTNDTVLRLDPQTNKVVAILPVGHYAFGGLAMGPDAVWVTNVKVHEVSKIDPLTNTVVATTPVGTQPAAIAIASGAVWVANRGSGTVSRIDPETDQVVAQIAVGRQPVAVAVGERAVWVPTPEMARCHESTQ